MGKLAGNSLYAAKKATSADATVLTATIVQRRQCGEFTYSFTPVRTASAQQLVSQRFTSKDSTFGAQSILVSHGRVRRQGHFARRTQQRSRRATR